MRTLSMLGWLAMPAALIVTVLACGAPKPPEGANEVKTDEPPKTDETAAPPAPAPAASASGGGGAKSANTYDKEHTEVVLKRAARSVKDSCGEAKDESGVATGPWGKVTVQVMLGRNGRSKGVTIPASHADKPVGRCMTNAFTNLTFPPWAGEDTQVDWEVELTPPAPPPAPSGSAKPAPPPKKK